MASETFKWNGGNGLVFSEGYGVRLMVGTDLQYTDDLGDVHIAAEAMSKPSTGVVVYAATIPDRPVQG